MDSSKGEGRRESEVGRSLDIKVGNFQLEEFSTRRLGTFVTFQVLEIPEQQQNINKNKKETKEKK